MTDRNRYVTPAELEALARYLAGRHLDDVDEWLLWDDVPYLTEDDLNMLADHIRDVASYLFVEVAKLFPGVNPVEVLERKR